MIFFDSWSFRTNRPVFSEGETVELFATGFDRDSETLLARVGDTILRIKDASPDLVDQKLSVRITSFNPSESTGTAELLDVFETSDF
ncbi:MAG: hypothetical protein ABEK50_01905 [bacterium]